MTIGECTYPETITADMLPQWSHISDAEVEKDIADTEAEIERYRALREAERSIADVHPDPNQRELASFRADGRAYQIEQREAFVAFLRRLQAARLVPA